jgi:flagellar basal body-associated protein FliL
VPQITRSSSRRKRFALDYSRTDKRKPAAGEARTMIFGAIIVLLFLIALAGVVFFIFSLKQKEQRDRNS